MNTQNVRWRVLFSGVVQGVGFRYQTRQIAEQFAIAGWIRNRSDGRVEMVAEAEATRLREFVEQVQSRCGRVDDAKIERVDSRELLRGFEIRH